MHSNGFSYRASASLSVGPQQFGLPSARISPLHHHGGRPAPLLTRDAFALGVKGELLSGAANVDRAECRAHISRVAGAHGAHGGREREDGIGSLERHERRDAPRLRPTLVNAAAKERWETEAREIGLRHQAEIAALLAPTSEPSL